MNIITISYHYIFIFFQDVLLLYINDTLIVDMTHKLGLHYYRIAKQARAKIK